MGNGGRGGWAAQEELEQQFGLLCDGDRAIDVVREIEAEEAGGIVTS